MQHGFSRLLVVAATIAACAYPLRAQNTITLEGSVKSEGLAIANAQITAVNVATLETTRALTRPTGDFRILGLFPGQYTVTVRSVGYKPASDTVQLVIGQRARLEFTM